MTASPALIPVNKPALPSAGQLLPYLQEIDANRYYSNFGPLNSYFEGRLAAHFGATSNTVVTVANGTVGLTLALMAQRPLAGSLCVVPAWTFVASAHAIVAAGLGPYLVDVDEEAGRLTPETAHQAIAGAPARVGAVMPVSPFGAPMDGSAWDRFREETGLAVVIDAAAGFDASRPTRVPTMVSLHATKILGVGEGGLILSMDTALIGDIRKRSNFGFSGSRESHVASLNAKMSEYHAAVGLAALDAWPANRTRSVELAARYKAILASCPGLEPASGWGESWISNTINVRSDRPVEPLIASLRTAGIETRQWWGRGLQRQPAFATCPRQPLAVTERIAATTLGLPFHGELGPDDLERIAKAVMDGQNG